MEKHFAIINKETDIVEVIMTVVDSDTCRPTENYYEIEIPTHDPDIWGKKYENGSFVEASINQFKTA